MSRDQPNIVFAHWAGLEFFDARDGERFGEVGRLLDHEPLASWDDPRAAELLAAADVIVGHWGCPPIDRTALDLAPNLGLFAYAAGTLKGVVTDALWESGVRVTSGANANAEPVAEFTLAAILWANKDVMWRRLTGDDQPGGPALATDRSDLIPVGNHGKTVGVIGASIVGRRVIELLGGFPHLAVTLYDPFVSAGEVAAMGATKLELDELCAGCDILSIHAPELPATRHMIAAPQLAALRTGATLINTARGSLVDHPALLAELESGRLRAILDVTEPEPLPADSPFRRLPNVWLTPHLAGSEGTELTRMTDCAIEEIRRWSSGLPAVNEVSKDRLGRLA